MRKRARLWPIFRLPPPTLNTGWWVTATIPWTGGAVLSVQPDGTCEARLPGTNGPCEWAVLQPDRLVYAPLGTAGAVFLLPSAADLPTSSTTPEGDPMTAKPDHPIADPKPPARPDQGLPGRPGDRPERPERPEPPAPDQGLPEPAPPEPTQGA
jgi:hypothetical protein